MGDACCGTGAGSTGQCHTDTPLICHHLQSICIHDLHKVDICLFSVQGMVTDRMPDVVIIIGKGIGYKHNGMYR